MALYHWEDIVVKKRNTYFSAGFVSTLPLLYVQKEDLAYIFKCHAVLKRLCEWARHCSSDNKGKIWSRDTLIDQDTVTMFTKANILPGKTSASLGAHQLLCFGTGFNFCAPVPCWTLACDDLLNISCDICFCFYPALHQMTSHTPYCSWALRWLSFSTFYSDWSDLID